MIPVTIAQKKGDAIVFAKDEHPRATTPEALAKLKGVVRPDGSVTAGNASGVNDGACALLLANEAAAGRYGAHPSPLESMRIRFRRPLRPGVAASIGGIVIGVDDEGADLDLALEAGGERLVTARARVTR